MERWRSRFVTPGWLLCDAGFLVLHFALITVLTPDKRYPGLDEFWDILSLIAISHVASNFSPTTYNINITFHVGGGCVGKNNEYRTARKEIISLLTVYSVTDRKNSIWSVFGGMICICKNIIRLRQGLIKKIYCILHIYFGKSYFVLILTWVTPSL